MSNFLKALTTKDLLTENGMPTHSTSGSFVVDLFYEMGGYRNGRKSLGELVGLFFAAYGENPNLAVKALFNLRDPRGGMGERRSGRILWNALTNAHPEVMRQLFRYIPEYGRWDDILALLDTPIEDDVLEFILESLSQGDKLCAKWMPRENKKHGEIAKYLAQRWGLSAKDYRQRLAAMTDVVETQMCRQLWEGIKFQSVPSVAMKRYRKAFGKHQQERFTAYLAAVEKGEAKINTSVLTPVDIVAQYWNKWSETDRALEVLWANLPNLVPDDLAFLPICDVSASMTGVPMQVSIALGIYLAQRNKSVFKNAFITFSHSPSLVQLTGKTLRGNMEIMRRINLAENTDLEKTFVFILQRAVEARLAPEDMPTHLMIISDMQFDQCTGRHVKRQSGWGYDTEPFRNSALEMIDRLYAESGYKRPNIFFWNVDTAGGIPAKIDDRGIGLISGYSPNLLRNVLRGELNPIAQVEAILNNGRYDFVNEVIPQ